MFFLTINKKQIIAAITIGMVSVIGDMNFENENNKLVAAVGDNVTHAIIGVLTWIGAFVNNTTKTDINFALEALICGIFSSIIDVDHFIAAKSLKLKDATSLKSRPFMHCTTLILFIVFTVLLLSYTFRVNWLFKFGWILASAFLSHHIRDSKRRGFWIWPFGHTMPVPFLVHIFAQMLFPCLLSAIVSQFSPPHNLRNEHVRIIENV